jgi:hypothetical protein
MTDPLAPTVEDLQAYIEELQAIAKELLAAVEADDYDHNELIAHSRWILNSKP